LKGNSFRLQVSLGLYGLVYFAPVARLAAAQAALKKARGDV
jgi:hypothetical protein